MPGDVIRVVLADDHAVVRAGLRAVLGTARDINVVGEAANGREAVALVERMTPDVLVSDLSMPEMDGTAATKAIMAKGLGTKILILTMHVEEEYLVPLLEAGANGYLVKSAADKELVAAVRAVAYGDTYVSRPDQGSSAQGSGSGRARAI
jgi:DNA-binding NarL/FixJ family response regulator